MKEKVITTANESQLDNALNKMVRANINTVNQKSLSQFSQLSDGVSDKNNSTNRFNTKKSKVLLAIVLILGTSTLALAELPVHDARHRFETILQFTKTIQEMRSQQAYRVMMDGAWQSPSKLIKVTETTLASLGVDTKKLGWLNDNFRDEKAVKVASESIERLNKVLKGDVKAGTDMSQVIQEIYGDIPVTRRGAQVRMAYETVTGTFAQTGDTQTAIKEILKNSDEIQAKLEAGGLTNGDRERLKGQQENLQLRLQTLQTQALMQNNQLVAQEVAMRAAKEAREEQERLRARSGMLGAMGAVAFSPGGKEIEGVE
jgi:hypothetical protein